MGTSTILVSHDLGVVVRTADRVAVMYAGKIVEIEQQKKFIMIRGILIPGDLCSLCPIFPGERKSSYTYSRNAAIFGKPT